MSLKILNLSDFKTLSKNETEKFRSCLRNEGIGNTVFSKTEYALCVLSPKKRQTEKNGTEAGKIRKSGILF
uniref:Uncharacterized protein n=1 Tax=Leptospira ellisii TaxID=2023197 RepID=A0A2N0BA20_9LEPT|nr:hypothetical protein CH379_08310 [Leptospira ellisii]